MALIAEVAAALVEPAGWFGGDDKGGGENGEEDEEVHAGLSCDVVSIRFVERYLAARDVIALG